MPPTSATPGGSARSLARGSRKVSYHAVECPQAFTALNLNPVLFPGTTLLWLIPLRHAGQRALWLALGIGAVGGLVATSVTAVLATSPRSPAASA